MLEAVGDVDSALIHGDPGELLLVGDLADPELALVVLTHGIDMTCLGEGVDEAPADGDLLDGGVEDVPVEEDRRLLAVAHAHGVAEEGVLLPEPPEFGVALVVVESADGGEGVEDPAPLDDLVVVEECEALSEVGFKLLERHVLERRDGLELLRVLEGGGLQSQLS